MSNIHECIYCFDGWCLFKIQYIFVMKSVLKIYMSKFLWAEVPAQFLASLYKVLTINQNTVGWGRKVYDLVP